jgi:hypothetical protein
VSSIDPSEEMRDFVKLGASAAISLREKAQRPPGSPLDQYLPHGIDPAGQQTFGKLCAIVKLASRRAGSFDSMTAAAGRLRA